MADPTATGALNQTAIFVPPPPRLSGVPQQDIVALASWFQQFYNSVGLSNYEVSGNFAIVGNDASCTIPFASNRQQPDDNYYVSFGVESFSGSPPLSALTVTNVAKSKDGFAVTINTPPGAGNSVTLAYSVRRQ